MKARLWILSLLCLLAVPAAQAQVIADFETEALGTGGFADNGWGTALTSVSRVADPTGASGFVLGLEYNGTAGVIEKGNTDPKNGHVISAHFYLPADFPDDGVIQFWGQDNANWSHTTENYNGVDLPKGKWVSLNFHIKGLNLKSPSTFNPYSPNQFGKWGVQISTAAAYTGQILIDDVTLLGDVPRVQADFETSLSEWANSGWSPGISSVERAADPMNAANMAMAIGLDFTLGNTGQLSSGQINLSRLDHVAGFKIWVPAEFPDENVIHIVGQDRSHWSDGSQQRYTGADLLKGQWNEIYLDILKAYETDSSSFTPYSSGGFGRIWIGFENNNTFTGAVYMDDIVLLQPAPPPTADLLSPAITVTAGLFDQTDPFTGEVFYYNDIEWTDLSADVGETYSLYFSGTGKITDVTAPGVIQISKHIGRGTQVWHHRMYTEDGGSKTVYYAMTVTGLAGGSVIEKAVRDGVSNSGPVTAATSKLFEIPFVQNFGFAADAYLDEFEALAQTFKRCTLRNQQAAGDESGAWTTESDDLNFTGYVVMDADNLYIAMNVVDDLSGGDAQCWAGDGFDFMGGLYDVRTLTSYWRGDDQQQGAVTDPNTGGGFRLGAAVGASQANHIQVNGYSPWDPDGVEYAQEVFAGGYIVEMKIPIASMNAKFNGSFVPADGMILCGKIDVNDNDTESTTATRSLQNHWGDVPGNFQSWQRAEAWAAPFKLTSTPLPSAVETRETTPFRFALDRNYPNPFNPGTAMNYQVARTSNVSIKVFDMTGREVRTLISGRKAAGAYTAVWDGTDNSGQKVTSGIYVCRMIAGGTTQIQKMTLLK
jgi:hypothetical protein